MLATLIFEVWIGPYRKDTRETLREFAGVVTFVEKKGLLKSEFRIDGTRTSVMHVRRVLAAQGIIDS